jgi:polyisoprenoid-binding protein YceI
MYVHLISTIALISLFKHQIIKVPMKHSFVVAAIAALVACQSAPKADEAQTAEAQQAAATAGATFKLDSSSMVSWIATKQTGQHNGIFKVADGVLAVDGSNLTGGSFTISVASLNVLDLTGEDKGKLEGHLKSPDFFEADKYPTAKFEITKVEPYDSSKGASTVAGATHFISGNLTLKDSTRNVTFPAKVAIEGGTVSAQADFNIDRTNWGMNYKGPNNPQDWFIRKEVNLKLDIKAQPAE